VTSSSALEALDREVAEGLAVATVEVELLELVVFLTTDDRCGDVDHDDPVAVAEP
jgi:hypothetical protein